MSIEYPSTSSLLTLPPEIYHIVASHLPVQSRSSTLLALALTTSQIYQHVQTLLYAKVIIKSEEHSFLVLGRILKDALLGALVREFHFMTDLPVATREVGDGKTIVTELHKVIRTGHLPHMHTLTMAMLPGWYYAEYMDEFEGIDHLTREFWEDLKQKCPRFRALFLDGFRDTNDDPWVDTSGLSELKELSHLNALSLRFGRECPRDGDANKWFTSLRNVSSSLHTLTLCLAHVQPHEDPTPILKLTFLHLKSLELAYFHMDKPEVSMDFWARHPGLERLILSKTTSRWFDSDEVEATLLPNLTHFRANYPDVRAMASHLPQLRCLAINNSLNGQIPYLLRSVLRGGLPGLKSLEINQRPYPERDVRDIEGAMWFETEYGEFRQETLIHKASRTMTNNYMHSIVRGAPNIEELCLQGFPLSSAQLKRLAPVLAHFPRLERLYYRAFGKAIKRMTLSHICTFILGCRPLANSCPLLRSVTNVSLEDLPYHVGKVIRDQQGSVVDIIHCRGSGMELMVGDDNPFPRNTLP